MKARPKTFTVSGRTFTVHYVRDHALLNDEDMGRTDYDHGRILVRTYLDGTRLPADAVREALWHELMHAAFWSAGLPECAENEDLILQVSNAVLQIVTSAK